GERLDETRLSGSGEPADDAITKALRQFAEHGNDVPAPRTVAAFELGGAKADLAQHVHERAAALAAAPAIDERRPFRRTIANMGLDDVRDVAGDECGTELARFERRHLDVERADARALGVVEHREVDGAGKVVERKFTG